MSQKKLLNYRPSAVDWYITRCELVLIGLSQLFHCLWTSASIVSVCCYDIATQPAAVARCVIVVDRGDTPRPPPISYSRKLRSLSLRRRRHRCAERHKFQSAVNRQLLADRGQVRVRRSESHDTTSITWFVWPHIGTPSSPFFLNFSDQCLEMHVTVRRCFLAP